MSDLLVQGGEVLTSEGLKRWDVSIRGGRIDAVGEGLSAEGRPVLSAVGRWVLPGGIDPQVHFREPGFPHKEDLVTGTLAAVAGGVTAIMEMPNTRPPTITPEALDDKLARAAGRTWCDHAFFLGATAEHADELGGWERAAGCAGVKVFMGSSTGTLLVPDDATLERVLRSGTRRVAVHSEDEDRLKANYAAIAPGTSVSEHPNVRDVEAALKATTRLLNVVEKTGRPIHLLHVSTAEEIALLRERDLGALVTAEVTPNHLILSAPECYQRYGTLAQMNPPVRDARHRDALREALADGVLTCIGSDHAPHTLAEKGRDYPQSPSGIPGVQTTLPLMLIAVREGWLKLTDLLRVVSGGPAEVYGIEGKGRLEVGCDGDVVLVDPSVREPLRGEWLRSRAAYSPYEGDLTWGWPVTTVLRGAVVYEAHRPVGEPRGCPLRFDSTER